MGESVQFPMLYYTHNVVGAVNLIEAMRKHNVKNVRLRPSTSCIQGPLTDRFQSHIFLDIVLC